jgi:hypothetical protein
LTAIEKSLGKLAVEINAEHRAFVGAFKKTAEHGIRAGELLATAKEQCPHGTWLPWLEENFEGAPRTAQEYMRLYNHRDAVRAKAQDSAHLSMSGALKEIASPRESFVETTLEYHQRKVHEHIAKFRQACFDSAESLSAIHHGQDYKHIGYTDFVSYVKGRFADQWVAHIADELVDERGEPYDVFKMASILFERGPDAMLEFLLANLPDEERGRLQAEWAAEDAAE